MSRSLVSRLSLLAPLSLVGALTTTADAQELPHSEVPSAAAGGMGRVRVTGNPGEAYAIWFSAIEEVTQIADGIILQINPLRALQNGLEITGIFDNSGQAIFEYPIDASWDGYQLSFQTVTVDEIGNIRVSNLARATFQTPNTFAGAVGVPSALSIFGDLFNLPDGRQLAIGGAGPVVQAYEPWVQQTLPVGIANPSYLFSTRVQLADGKVLVAGGLNATVDTSGKTPQIGVITSSEAYLYDPVANTYNPTNGPLNVARAAAAGVRLNTGKVFIFGGLGTIDIADPTTLLTGILASSEIYDPATGLFTLGPSLVEGKAFHTCTLLNNGQVLVAGGLGLAFGIPVISNSGYTYNPSNNTFGLFPKFFSGPRMLHSATKLADGKVVLSGGITADLTAVLQSGDLSQIALSSINSTAFWDPTASFGAGSFKVGPILPAPRALHTSTLMADGVRTLLAGGISGDISFGGILTGDLSGLVLPDAVVTTEFVSVTPGNLVVPGPDLVSPRVGASAIRIPMDGRILIFGGGPLAPELYQP